MTIIALIITLFYVFLIGCFINGFNRLPVFLNNDNTPETKFSIIIPFRNEAKNLPELLASLKRLNYPKNLYEFILVDDDSQDLSTNIIIEAFKNSTLAFRIIDNIRVSNSPKKDAITAAINLAQYEWIITTDADCVLPQLWLETFDCFIQKNEALFIAGPVNYHNTNSFLQRFQALDFMSLIGVTIGSFGIKKPFLCNGANLAYKKEFFFNIEGFKGNNNIASGDDIFLLEKALKAEPNKVKFLKSRDAIVLTKPEINLANLIAQRVRWASKTANYNNWFGKFVGVIVLLMNALVISTFILSLFQVFSIKIFASLFIIKFVIDFLLLFKTSQFFNTKKQLSSFLISSIVYPFFSLYIVFKALFSSYKWKGRRFSK